jgi:WD40 repeat protein
VLEPNLATVVTSSHVIEGARFEVTFGVEPSRTLPVLPNDVIQIETENRNGLAVFRVRGQLPKGLGSLPLASGTTRLSPGDSVFLVGYPEISSAPRTLTGTFSGRQGNRYAIDREVGEGMSGGPVVVGGQAVGLITDSGRQFTYAVPFTVIREFLMGSGVSLSEATPSTTRTDGGPPRPSAKVPGGTLELLTTPRSEIILNGEVVGTANEQGQVTIPNVGAGRVRLQIRRPGYKTSERTILVNAGEITTLSETLTEVARPAGSDPGSQPVPNFSLSRSLAGHLQGVRSVAFSPDSRLMASGGDDGTMRLWEVSTGRQLKIWELTRDLVLGGVVRVAFSPDGRLLGGASGSTLSLVDVGSGDLLRSISRDRPSSGGAVSPFSFAFSTDSRQVAIAGRFRELPSLIFDAASGKEVLTIAACCAVMAIPDGGWLVLRGGRREIRTFDRAGKVVRTIALPSDREHEYVFATVTPDGRWLAAVDEKYKHIQLWDTTTGREGYALKADEKEGIYEMKFSQDGRWLVSRSTTYLPDRATFFKIWDMSTGRQVASTQSGTGSEEAGWSLGYSPDGNWLSIGLNNGSIKLWRKKP